MNSDKQSAKKTNPPKRRISALQKVAGSIPEGKDVGSSLDDFIATANQTLTDTDAFKLTSDLNSSSEAKAAREKKEKEDETAAIEAAAAQTAAEVARVAAEEAARKVLAEVTRNSAQQMAQLEEKLAKAEARASSAELEVRKSRQIRAPRLPSPSFEDGPDFAEGSYSKPFGRFNPMQLRSRRSAVIKAVLIAGAAAAVAGGVFLVGNGRLWNTGDEPAAQPPVAQAPAVAKAPAVTAPAVAAPEVTALPAEPTAQQPAAEKAVAKAEVKAEPLPAEPAATPQPTPAAGSEPQPTVPVVASLAPSPAETGPTVTRLDDEDPAPAARKPAKKKKKATRSSRQVRTTAKKAESGKKPTGGIVDPFAQ